jgi:hypothetical protein
MTIPKYLEDSVNVTFAVSETNCGKDGIIIPSPIESRQMVIKMKISADLEFRLLILQN